jgi:hypothetical protein
MNGKPSSSPEPRRTETRARACAVGRIVSRSPSELTSISGWRTETNSASRAIIVPSVGASRSVRVRYVFSRKRLLGLCQNCVRF